ncbi:YihY/virulence factor BrkB family protein [Sphingomonas bacterium]|uniref:YihY/virulence factor BrkB family protein n=1 Tax=Sphingomonas bacterium TaxID=1895847 RepID=UPI001576AF5D|nr:YihY/virulence factor BrkB family protein [Sphingomonas bacterium]
MATSSTPNEIAPALTPEDRARQPGRFQRELGRLHPGAATVEVVKRAGLGVFNDGFIHAGNLAYLALMTLFPFFITAAAVFSVLGQSAEAQRAVVTFLHTLPRETAVLLRGPIVSVVQSKTGALLWVAGVVGLWTVSGFIETIRDIFRRAYGTSASAPFWRARLASSGAIILAVVLAMLSFLVQGVLAGAEQFIYRLIPGTERLAGWLGLSRLIPGAIMFGALYLLFYLCTPSKYRRTSSRKWPGALVTALWWILITAALPAVLSLLGGYGATYGSLAGVAVMLLFFWLVGLGFVFGAHLNAALAEPRQATLEGGDAAQVADDGAAGARV